MRVSLEGIDDEEQIISLIGEMSRGDTWEFLYDESMLKWGDNIFHYIETNGLISHYAIIDQEICVVITRPNVKVVELRLE